MSTKNNAAANRFGSYWGFIMSAVGCAVGMANVWAFPAKVGQNGGGAFILVYLFFVVLFGSVLLAAEYGVGRRARSGTLAAYRLAFSSRDEKHGKLGQSIGWLPLIGSLLISLAYASIIAYLLKGFWDSLTGTLITLDVGEWFGAMSSTEFGVVPFHVVVVVGSLATLLLGAKTIELSCKVMMPVFYVIFIILAVRVAMMPGAIEGYKFMFTPDWSYLAKPTTWLWAAAQAFFSLSVTGSGMIVYGAYLDEKEDLVHASRVTALLDTSAAMLAACVVIPACFAYNLDVGSGASLLFITLPTILHDIAFGQVFAVILFAAMVFAGVSSIQNMYEVVLESVMRVCPKLSRNVLLVIMAAVCLGIGVFIEPISKWGPLMDFISIYVIQLGALIGAISWFWVMKKKDLMDEINKNAKKTHGDLWYYAGKFGIVGFTAVLCAYGLIHKVAF